MAAVRSSAFTAPVIAVSASALDRRLLIAKEPGMGKPIPPFWEAARAGQAVAAGACRYARVFRANHNPAGRYGFIDPTEVSVRSEAGMQGQFNMPYGVNGYWGGGARLAFCPDGRRQDHRHLPAGGSPGHPVPRRHCAAP